MRKSEFPRADIAERTIASSVCRPSFPWRSREAHGASVIRAFLPCCLQENPQAALLLGSQASRQTPLQADYPAAHAGSAAPPAHE